MSNGVMLGMGGERRDPVAVPDAPVDVARIRPRGDQVLIRRLKTDEMTEGGIVMPAQYKNDFFKAEVLAIGPGGHQGGVRCPADDLSVGDIVVVMDEVAGPNGHVSKHLLPVTPTEKEVVMCLDQYIIAIEDKETKADDTSN